MLKIRKIKQSLNTCISDLCNNPSEFLNNPQSDFKRNRKLSMSKIIKVILYMTGGTLHKELLEFFDFSNNTPTASAFVQQRSKIKWSAFEFLLHRFNKSANNTKLYRGYRLFAIDGSDLHIPTNPDDKDSFYPGANGQKSYNLLHFNAMYDLMSSTYTDAIIQKRRNWNEHKAFVDMVDIYENDKSAIFIADRGYESYNNMAHVQEKGQHFLIRIKDINGNGIASGLHLPDCEFDISHSFKLTRKQTNSVKDNVAYKFVPHTSTFDFLPDKCKKSINVLPYNLHIRFVRFKITDDTYELIATNLSNEQFPPIEIKNLYSMRWGIETSFRDLKYTIGLLHFHSKKTEHIYQEIFAKIIMYNYTELITACSIIEQNKKYQYKVNFSVAAYICRCFFVGKISFNKLRIQLNNHIIPIRLDRKRPRKLSSKSAISFTYRVA